MEAGVGLPVVNPHAPRPNQWGLAAYWFSLNFQSAALLTIVIPETLNRLANAHRTADLGRLAALTAVLAMVVPPLVGVWSDRLRHRGVVRLPWVVGGTIVNVGGILLVMQATSLTRLTLTLMVALVGQGAATAGYQAMMPEVVPRQRWGLASGYMGLASLAGTIAGLGVAGLTSATVTYQAMAGTALVGAAVTAWSVREPREVPPALPSGARIANVRRFSWVFAARFGVLFGQTLLMTFVLYFFESVMHLRTPATGTALVAGLALVGAGFSTWWLGRASDRRDRAVVVAAACLPMAAAATGFGLFPNPSVVYALAVLWGMGYGGFLSVDWALALDSIPDLGNVARDLGIWGIASNLPAVVAPVVGAWILSRYANPVGGYRMLFLTAGASFLAGSVLVWPLRQHRRSVAWPEAALVFVVAVLLKTYVMLAYRVQVIGRLPRPRTGLMVLGNHFQDLEGMVLPATIYFSDPRSGPVVSAGSRRLFEPGFLASRSPRWLGRWLTPINLATILTWLGVYPIENTPLRRPLVSWAYAVWLRHGDLSFDEVFDSMPGGVPEPAQTLSDLWRPGRFPQDGPWVPHTVLREPYRQEIRDHLRRSIEDELDQLRRALAGGSTVYLTPEGRMSGDGQLGRFRAALDHLWPAAAGVFLAATATDPWTYRRLTLVVRLFPAVSRDRVRDDLLRRRPITLAHLVASVLLAHPHGGSEADLQDAVERLADHLAESGAWLTDEARQPARHWRRVLRHLERRGVIRRTGAHWQPGPTRHDPRFPHVPDVVAALATQLAETAAALGARAG
jgi:MFS family permease